MSRLLLAMFVLTSLPVAAQAPFAARPYMGWSSWSFMRTQPTEEKIFAQADALKASGLDTVGFRYINVDDGWSSGWGADGLPVADSAKFPHGMDGLANALHRRGLLFGIYLNPGIREELYRMNPSVPGTRIHIQDFTDVTQAGSTRNPRRANDPKARAFRIDFDKPGAREYVQAEVEQLAAWGVDFLKLDFVGPGGGDVTADNRRELKEWHRAIGRLKKPIWLELSNFMSIDQAAVWKENANGWRIENDIECYGCDRDPDPAKHGNLTEWSKVVERFSDVRPWLRYAGSGGWNDLDTLELGNGDKDGLTPAERQSMYVLWAITCAPLYLGSDLTRMDAGDLALIKNEGLIELNQRGLPGHPVDLPSLRRKRGVQLWSASASHGGSVLAVFNLGDAETTVTVPLQELDSVIDSAYSQRPGVWGGEVYDELDHKPVGHADNQITLIIPAHGVRVIHFIPVVI